MNSGEKISGYQLSLLFFTFITSTLILSVPGIMVSFAKQNAWLSIIPASLTGLVNIFVMTALAKRYPGQTIIQYLTAICGKWAGKLLGFYCTYYLLFVLSSIVNESTGFLNANLLILTPPLVLMVTMLIMSGLAVLAGIETIGRCNEVIVLIIVVMLIPIFISAFRDADPARLTPVLADGLVPVIQGSIVPSAWMSQFYFLGWFLPHIQEKPQQLRPKLLSALGSIIVLIIVIDLLTIMVFGPITPRMRFAFLNVVKYASVIGPLERMETIAITIWILGIFIKVSMLLYMLCISATQLFGAKNYRKTVVPVTVLTAVSSVWIFRNEADSHNWIMFTYPVLAFVTQSLLPLALLAIDTVKARFVKY